MTLLKFDPVTGAEKPYASHPEQYRAVHGLAAWLYNPYTGAPRDARDIGTDTFGLLLLPTEAVLQVASAAPAAPQLEWSATLLDGEAVNYEKAEAAVKALGEGWRIPTRQELESILDLTRRNPAVNPEKFPGTKSAYYWTSTPYASDPTSAVWVVAFSLGSVDVYGRSYLACLRACRSLPASQ